jgi:Holliday junction resolvase
MISHYKYGRKKELQVGEFLQRRGFAWGRSQGSRGPIDLIAQKGSRKLAIQVKASRKKSISSARLTQREEAKLLDVTEGRRVTPVLALVAGNFVCLLRVTDGKILFKGELKPLKYIHADEA